VIKDASTGRGGPTKQRTYRVLVIAEIALALVLLCGAGLLIRSLYRLQLVDPGFSPQNLLTMNFTLSLNDYAEIPKRTMFYEQVLQNVIALPGVKSAAFATELPFGTGSVFHNFIVEGRSAVTPGSEPEIYSRGISSQYFSTMNIPIRRGRAFQDQDNAASLPVGILNDAAVHEFFPGTDPIGKRVRWAREEPVRWITVVGVAGDVRSSSLDQQDYPAVYTPLAQERQWWKAWNNLIVKANADPNSLIMPIRKQAGVVNRNVPVADISTMDERMSQSLGSRRFQMIMLGAFAGLALLLAAIGIYGVVTHTVRGQTREIAVRMALGAERERILRMILRQGLLLAAIGVTAGLIASFVLTRFLRSFLYSINPFDPFTYALVSLILIALVLFACYLPARRAAGTNPSVVLRYE
jgi:putative ABC transport system permease protein